MDFTPDYSVNAEPVVFHWTYKLDETHEKEPEENTAI